MKIWKWPDSLSGVIGVVLRFVTLPAAIIGVIAFWEEIRDNLMEPDVAVDIEYLTIRCFYRSGSG